MEKLQLISVRIDPDTLAKIDEFADEHYYWKRNTVINRILESVFHHFSKDDIFDMVNYNRYATCKTEATFKIHKPNG